MRHEVSGTATPHDAVAADPSVPRDVLVYRRVGDPSSRLGPSCGPEARGVWNNGTHLASVWIVTSA
jgi:hypothetical protein